MAKSKEIIFISNFLGNGGAARVISVLADAFVDDGYSVMICMFPFDGIEYLQRDKVKYLKLYPRGAGIRKKLDRIILLRKELKKHLNATIISFEYFMNMQTIIAALGLRNRLVVSERNDPARMGGKFPVNVLRNMLYQFCDTLVCQTPDAKAYFPARIQNHTVIIPNPIKDDLPEPWHGERNKEIVNFCRLEKQKNLPLLIDAFEQFHKVYPNYSLHIYGDGNERANLENYIIEREMQEYAFLHPSIPDIHQRILKSAMFVSSSDYEGLSNSMLEAMTIGLPTICTDCPCGGARMVINPGHNGILVPVGSIEHMVAAMKRVASDKKLNMDISKEAAFIRNRLAIRVILNEWIKIIDKC